MTAETHLRTFAEISAAVESGAGLPAAIRAMARALDARVAVLDQEGGVLAIAAGSQADEQHLLTDPKAVILELRVADTTAGTLRVRGRSEEIADEPLLRMISTLIALEVDRTRAPQHAGREAAAKFVRSLLDGAVAQRQDLIAYGKEFGVDLEAGGSVAVARVTPLDAGDGDWRTRVLAVVERGVRGVMPGSVMAPVDGDIFVLLAGDEVDQHRRAAESILRELQADSGSFKGVIGLSRQKADPIALDRAGKEALLAANVAASGDQGLLAFGEAGAYRLLLPALIDDPGELERFYAETVGPLVDYDEQYRTDLVNTLVTYLENDGHSEGTARALHTHRHTIRYRLERIKEISGLNVGSSEGREMLSLGLKSMRALGIPAPPGPGAAPAPEIDDTSEDDT